MLIAYPGAAGARRRRGGDGGARRHPFDRRELAAAPDAWSIATASPPRPARSSTSSRAGAALAVYAILAGGKTAEAGEAALRREIARFRDTPVSAAELAEAKNELLTGALRERETADGRASALAEAVIVDGDPAPPTGGSRESPR